MAASKRYLIPLLLIALVTGCGGGGGGGSKKTNNAIGGFGAVGGPTGNLLAGLNDSIQLVFNDAIDPASVTQAAIKIVTIDDVAGVSTQPAGVLASYELSVIQDRVFIKPTIEFTPQQIVFGFVAQALFEISFTSAAITSISGAPMVNPEQSYFFRTPAKATDAVPGYPLVEAYVVDNSDGVNFPSEILDSNVDGNLTAEALAFFDNPMELPPPAPIPTSPVGDVIFIFNDALLPQTVINTVDGSSSQISVFVNAAPAPQFEPEAVPSTTSIIHQQQNLTIVRWRPSFLALPPGGLFIVSVGSQIQDLAGNSQVGLTGDASPLLSSSFTVAGLADGTEYTLYEPFESNSQEDFEETSASWGGVGDLLTPLLGGGRGLDGPLVIDPAGSVADPGTTEKPLPVTVDFDARRVHMPTVEEVSPGIFEPRIWELTRFDLPTGWTLAVLTDRDGDGAEDVDEFVVQSPGHPLDGLGAPLLIKATSDVDVAGTIDVTGRDGPSFSFPTGPGDPDYADYLGRGSPGADALQASGDGGAGGNSLLALDVDDDGEVDGLGLGLKSPPVSFPGTPFDVADPLLRGVTGRSTVLTSSTLFDPDTDLSLLTSGGDAGLYALVQAGEIRLQPNLGIGSTAELNAGTSNQFIDENHRTFVVDSVDVVDGATTITIKTDNGESLDEPSDNFGTGYAPIAAAGDSYIVGQLHGAQGSDPCVFDRGGMGAEPYVVVNEGALGITTTGGGGGGGGGISVGSQGGGSGLSSDPTVNQRGSSGGIALDDSAGGLGGLPAIRATGRIMSETEMDLVSQEAGRPLAEVVGLLEGSQLVVNVPNDGWAFEIVSFDGLTFTIDPIQVVDLDIGLTTGPAGPSGPGLGVGNDVPFLILPRAGLGGGGGGGTGVSVTGTVNAAASVLPSLRPGAGGAAGGGVVEIETARTFALRTTGRVVAEGGTGGVIDDPVTTFAAGGGGGGGSATIRAGLGVQLFQGAFISVGGGLGGGVDGFGRGGEGGAGWLRFETFADDLSPATFTGITVPAVAGENVGRLIGLPQGVAQSRFYEITLANADFQEVAVSYQADTDGDGSVEPDLTWSFDGTGADGGPELFDRPPFRALFSSTGVNDSGFIDTDALSPTFYAAYDLVSGRTGYAWDAVNETFLYSVGESTDRIHIISGTCLGTGCPLLILPTIPSSGSNVLDIVSLTVGGPDLEIYLLERGRGLVHVVDRQTGLYLRQITLPSIIEGSMALLSDGIDPANDRLVIANNREDVLFTYPTRDPEAAAPRLTDFAPAAPENEYPVTRDGEVLDIELTGLSLDPATEKLWCVNAPTGELLQVNMAPGLEGRSDTGFEVFTTLTAGGENVVLSSLAFDGTTINVVRSVDPGSTTVVGIDPASITGPETPLISFGSQLPEAAHSIADGDKFLRFRIIIDGTFDDEDHPSGTVSFREVAIDEITFTMNNAEF